MKRTALLRFALSLSVLLLAGGLAAQTLAPTAASSAAFAYPETRKVEHVDEYHGVKVADPYRWLEDADSAETQAWVEAQNKLTFGYLAQIPEREAIKQRLTKLWNYERYGTPFKRGGRYFFTKNDGLQNQAVLYSAATLDGTPKVVLDPNTLSPDGTVALSGHDISEDGKLIVYGLSVSGSDWTEWKVREVETGRQLPDHIKWVKFSGASFTKDGRGFFYSRYDQPDEKTMLQKAVYFQKLYYHRIGTPQAEDELIYERPDEKEMGFRGGVTDDGRYLVISVWQGSARKNRVYYKDLAQPGSPVVKLLDDFDASYTMIDNVGPVFYFRTDLDAPRNRVIAIDIRDPQRAKWKTIIPEAAETINGAGLVNDTFVISYLKDAYTEMKMYDLQGKFVRQLQLPGIGSASGFRGKRTDTEAFYSFTSYTDPSTIYRYDMKTGKSTIYRRPKVDVKPEDYETRQVFFASKDGTRVPMFVTYRKGIKLDGNNPTYLTGYGGFNVAQTPSFSVSNLVWMEMGGVLAVANLRGGGEYGKPWHEAGTKLKKQNVFDDFIAAAEWLVANKYTSSARLAIGGGSNGGLLVGAVLNQRPGLFGAAIPAVGVMDMLRFHKFTIGWGWVSDYGSSDDPAEFKAIYAYSPLHNIKRGAKYPATLITTADHDDRVVPAHSFKYAGTLQAAQAGDAPILIRIQTKAGHGAGKPTTKIIEEAADKWAFLVRELHISPLKVGTQTVRK